jgi:hypothetical protein
LTASFGFLTFFFLDISKRADLVTVNLGPSGEWFLKTKNGRMWWDGISNTLDRAINHILDSRRFVHQIDFGENESYFLSFNE